MPRRAVSPNIRSARLRASPLAAPHAPRERLKHPQRAARLRCALIRARSARALRAPAAAAARHARPRHAGLPRPVVRPSRPCRACGAEAGRQAITGRPPGLRSPAPPYHRRGSSQGRNAAARRCLLGAGGDGERPGPAECPDYPEKQKILTGRHCLSHIATRGRAASGEPNLTRVGVAPGANIGGHPHTTSRKEPKLSILTGTERAPGHKKTRRRKPSRDHPNCSRTPGARRPAETSWLVKARRRTLGHAAFRTHHRRSAARAGISHTAVAEAA